MGILSSFTQIPLSYDIEKDIKAFFEINKCDSLAEHTQRVAAEAERLALRFGVHIEPPVTAALLHDLSRVLPDNQFINAAEEFGIRILAEERLFPGLLHQKISRFIAYEIFKIRDNLVLDAIECHTTLKAGATDVDLILFVADKLSWDSSDSEQIIKGIRTGLEKSLGAGAFYYINDLCTNKDRVTVLHPLLLDAHRFLMEKC